MSPSTATNRDLHSEAEAIAKRILSRKVTDHDASLVFELSNRLLRAEGDTAALQATASSAHYARKLAQQQRDELLAALAEAGSHIDSMKQTAETLVHLVDDNSAVDYCADISNEGLRAFTGVRAAIAKATGSTA